MAKERSAGRKPMRWYNLNRLPSTSRKPKNSDCKALEEMKGVVNCCIRGFARNTALLLVIGALIDVSAVNASHFRGGTISWAPDLSDTSNRTILFTFRLAWSLQHEHCDNSTIATNQLVGDSDHKWICAYGCAGPVASTRIHCSDYNVEENWMTGSNTFSQAFDANGPFDISYMYCCWMNSLMTTSTSEWALTTRVILGLRNDTGRPNHAPAVHSSLSMSLQVGVPATIQMNITDQDGDRVKCRLGLYFGECGNACALNSQFELDSATCQLKYTPTTNSTGLVPIALIVEDFVPSKVPVSVGDIVYAGETPISSVPFQFVVQLQEDDITVQNRCRDVAPTITISHESPVIFVKISRSLQVTALATACNPSDRILAFNGTGPQGVIQSPISIVDGKSSITLSWTPNEQQLGRHNICLTAQDSKGLYSAPECYEVVVEQELKYCHGISGTEYITFDHFHYTFAGGCHYQLALTTFDPAYAITANLQPFNISVSNELDRGGQPRISAVRITVAQRFVEIHRNRRVVIDGVREIWPVNYPGFLMDMRGRFITLTTTSGVVVKYDGAARFSIGLPPQYSGLVQGLCGNMNGVAGDEFIDDRRKTSIPAVMGPLQFGNRFILGSCNVPIVLHDECTRPQNAANALACSLLTSPPGCFSACHRILSPDPFYQSCIAALCRSRVYQRTVLNIQIGAYADACQAEGAVICDWRQRIGAAMECLPNSRYVACSMSEPQTCANLDVPPLATTSCVEGCQCDEGYVLSGDQCVHTDQCGCFIQGKYRLPGFVYRTSDCLHQCTCIGVNGTSCIPAPPCYSHEQCGVGPDGFSRCFERTVLPSTCHALGDPHHKTFDGAAFDSMSTCAHVMVRSRSDSTITPFSVIAINDQPRINHTVSHVTEVHIVVGVNQTTRITLSQGPVVMVNGAIVYPGTPFNGFSLRKVGVFVIVAFDFGLVVRWDGIDRLRISAWSPLSRHVEGLCGNYDGDASNDFAAANGGGLITDVDKFVNSWMVTGIDINGNHYPIPPRNRTEICRLKGFTGDALVTCVNTLRASNESCRPRRAGDIVSTCDSIETASYRQACSIITDPSGPFLPCHSIIDPIQTFQDCVFDLCAYQGNQSFMERILASYDYDCRENNVSVVGWRDVVDMPFQCGANSVFSTCMNQCQSTCSDPGGRLCEAELDLGNHCVEGCQCADGFVQSNNGSGCIPQELCGCVVYSRYQLKGFIYRRKNCSEECVCLGNNQVQCRNVSSCKINLNCVTDSAGYQRCDGRLRRRATCKAVTDPHYMTFDKTRYDSMGTCAYIMISNGKTKEWLSHGQLSAYFMHTITLPLYNAPSALPKDTTIHPACCFNPTTILPLNKVGSTAPNFTVVALNVQPQPHQFVSHVKELYVHFNKNETMVFKEGPVVTWNGLEILPGTEQSNFVVRQGGRFIVVEFDFRLVIKWDGIDRVRIHAWQELRHQVEGLCGDFDDDASNDLRTSWGHVTTNLTTFVRSWEASGYSGEGCFLPPPTNASDICPSQEALRLFGQQCSLLTNKTGPFSTCHDQVNPWNSFRDCLYDLCATNGSLALKDRIFSSYITDCLGADRPPADDWRQQADLPINCTANQHYNTTAPQCQPTCTDPFALSCAEDTDLTEGCICNEGYILSGSDCVRREECGCLVNGIYHRRGFIWRTDDCSEECECLGLNGTRCVPSATCPRRSRCQIDRDGFRRCVMRPRRRATCKAVTDPHYMTFDGIRFDSMGMCSYIMVRNRANATVDPFRVVAVNQQPEPHRIVSHVKEVYVEFDGNQTMRFMAGPNITLNGVAVIPGYDRDGIKIRVVGHFWLVDWSFGLTIRWDGADRLRISVWSPLRYQVEGACGNFNDNPIDDLMTPSGELVTNYDQFVDSWIIEGYGAEGCPPVAPSDVPTDILPPPCSDPVTLSRHNDSCFLLVDPNGPMAGCQGIVNATAAYRSCLYDQCAYDGDKAQKERVMASYIATCVETETDDVEDSDNVTTELIKPPVWRPSANLTEPDCPPNSHFDRCLPQCQPTCNDPNMTSCAKDSLLGNQCVEGCTANSGYILSGSSYVRYERCGCVLNGVYYRSGERFLTHDCSLRCSCIEGSLSCLPHSCGTDLECRANGLGALACLPWRTSRCEVSGNLHFLTYDNQLYDLKRPCSYQLSSLSGEFTIILRTVQEESNISRMQMVTVILYHYNVTIEMDRTPMGVLYMVNGDLYDNELSLPPTTPRQIVIQRNGLFVTINTNIGLRVEFNGNQLMVYSPILYANQVQGLCGNMNGIAEDDLMLRNGSVSQSVQEFASQFDAETCTTLSDEPPEPLCTDEQKITWSSNSMCGMLKNRDGALQACNRVIRFSTTMRHFNQCIADMCSSQGDNATLTQAIESYAHVCLSNAIQLCNWREATGVRSANVSMCGANSHYDDCASACPATCGVVPFPQSCPMLESCVCNNGYILQGEQCVANAECNCQVKDTLVTYGTRYLTSNCQIECTCYGDNKTTCNEVNGCSATQECIEQNGMQSCKKRQNTRATCTYIGGSHYTTFDGYTYAGLPNCGYTLIRSNLFEVYVNDDSVNDNPSTPREIGVRTNTNLWALVTRYSVTVNGYRILPGSQRDGVNVTKVGDLMVVSFPFSLVLRRDSYEFLQLDVSSPATHNMEGLCGDFDGDSTNDGMENAAWRNNSSRIRCELTPPPLTPPCTGSNLTRARDNCNLLLDGDGPFGACHDFVDPRAAFESCVRQSCKSGHNQAVEMIAVTTYADRCRNEGGPPGLLDPATIVCPENSIFTNCGPQCQPTCTDRDASFCQSIPQLGQQCFTGCQCDPGFLSHNGLCIEADMCDCVAPWVDYIKNETTAVDYRCTTSCECSGGSLTCTNISCYMDQFCGARNGVYGCHWIDQCEYNNGGCSHSCTMMNDVIVCSCPPGLTLADNGTTCISNGTTDVQCVDGQVADRYSEWRQRTFTEWSQKLEAYLMTARGAFNDPNTAPHVCGSRWTIWLDRDDPGGLGDDESASLLRHEYPHVMCQHPVAIEARLADGRPATLSGNYVTMCAEDGLLCINDAQPEGRRCMDFQVRFLCLETLL